MRKKAYVATLLIVLLAGTVVLVSCSGSATPSSSGSSGEKLPPGATDQSVTQQTTAATGTNGTSDGSTSDGTPANNSSTTNSSTSSSASTKLAPVTVAGGYFEVIKVTRRENNKQVVSGSARQVSGDYLEIELQVTNTNDTLLGLSQFSFRLESPGIDAYVYDDYYGSVGTYGAAVSANVISGTLLDYSNLQQASYTLKSGEKVGSVFLFFDLNPLSTAKNSAVTLENTNLIIKKTSGTDYGDKGVINLATPAS